MGSNKIKHSKRKKSKSKSRRKTAIHNSDSDGDYNPNHTENSEVDMNCLDDDANGDEDDIFNNHLRKRRKVMNGTNYVKTNGNDSHRPKTFNVAPRDSWFPLQAINKAKIKLQNQNNEADTQLFVQSCFELLQFREWVSIGYQTKFTSKKHKNNGDRVQIVRCLLCDAEGTWSAHKAPRHKQGCDFIQLKSAFACMQPHFIDIPLLKQSEVTYTSQPNIIPPTPKMSHLPPLPSHGQQQQQHSGNHHHRFMPPPAFPPPFFTQIPPPMFPPNPSYQILPNQQQPPPLMKDSKSLIKTEQSDKNKK